MQTHVYYILHLRVEGLYVRGALSRQPELADRAIVVHKDGTVIECCSKAAGRGVGPEMPLKTAKAFLDRAAFVPYDSEDCCSLSETWLDCCVPYTDLIESDEPHSAYLDLSGHPDPQSIAEECFAAVVKQWEGQVMAGAAQNKWLSKLRAEVYGCALDYAEPVEWLHALPVSCLSAVEPEIRQRLEFLGFRTIGDAAELSQTALQDQFGSDAIRIAAALKANERSRIRATYPQGSVSAELQVPEGINSELDLHEALHVLAKRLARKLQNEDAESQAVHLWLQLDSGERLSLNRTFMRAVHSSGTAFTALKSLVKGQVASTVYGMKAQLRNLRHTTRRQQAFMLTSRSDIGDSKALQLVRDVFGQDSVRLAAEIEVPRRVEVLREWRDAYGW